MRSGTAMVERVAGAREVETVALRGHVLDNGVLTMVLDEIMDRPACDYEIITFNVGKRQDDESLLILRVESDDPGELAALVERLQSYGANPVSDDDVTLRGVTQDGVLPRASTPPRTCPPGSGWTAAGSRWTTRRWTARSSST
jgi:hypothetical protein